MNNTTIYLILELLTSETLHIVFPEGFGYTMCKLYFPSDQVITTSPVRKNKQTKSTYTKQPKAYRH